MVSSAAFLIISSIILAAHHHQKVATAASSYYFPKRSEYTSSSVGEDNLDPRKRPFCNAFTGCGRKRSDPRALAPPGGIGVEPSVDESIDSLLQLSAEPAVEDLSRQIMSEAKLWEAIQEASVELAARRKAAAKAVQQGAETAPIQGSATGSIGVASCAIPPCYI